MSSLKAIYGDAVELTGANGTSDTYRIVAELQVGGLQYAILQRADGAQEDDIEVFRIVRNGDGEPELETVEDDDEWETVAEAYDDTIFGGDEQP